MVPSGSVVENLPANAKDTGLIPGSRRSPGEGNDYPQYSCLENPMDGGAWHGYCPRDCKRVRHDLRIKQQTLVSPAVWAGLMRGRGNGSPPLIAPIRFQSQETPQLCF